MMSLAPHRRRLEPLSITVTIAVLMVVLLYAYLEFKRPVDVLWSSYDWIVNVEDPRCRSTTEDPGSTCLQLGDRILEIDGVTSEEFLGDRSQSILTQGPATLVVLRGEEVLTVELGRSFSGMIHLLTVLISASFPLIFWLAGACATVMVRPRDRRWLVLVAFNYSSALLFSAGILSKTQQAHSSTVTLISIAFFAPLIIHLHLLLPDRIFPRLEQWLMPILYAGAVGLVGLNVFFYRSPPTPLALLPIVAIGSSLAIFIARQLRGGTPEVRTANRLMAAGVALGLVPWLAALIVLPERSWGELPFGTHEVILAALALITLPNWPLSYLLAIHRTEAGSIKLRANRALGTYAFWSLYVLSFVVFFLIAGSLFPILNRQPLLSGLLVSLPFVGVAPALRRQFQSWVDRRIFGIRYSPDELVRNFATRIPMAADREALRRTLVDDVLPQLMIRQSALVVVDQDDHELLYAQDVDGDALTAAARSIDDIIDRYGTAVSRAEISKSSEDLPAGLTWVRAAVPLFNRGESLGVWLLGRRDPDDEYPPQDLQSLRLLANQVAALYRSQLEHRENRQLHDQLLHSQKMEAMGRLSAGIAHDFNNLLSAILGYSDLLLSTPEVHDPVSRQYLEGIKEAGDKAAALTSQLLAFSRQQAMETRVVDLNDLVGHLETLLRRVIEEDIVLGTDLCSSAAYVYVDTGHLEQVVLNLAVNASDAMQRGGALTLRTELVTSPPEGCPPSEAHSDIPQGRYVRLQVSDTGAGIPPEILDQIFEPFFTTKRAGKGTGLGLSMVYGIVTQSHGHIRVDSTPGAGTTFSIYLPQSTAEPAAEDPSKPQRAYKTSGAETILLVEDEASVRKVVQEILRSRGYTILEATDGAEALRVAAEFEGDLDLVLTDVMMPNMRGPQMVEELLRTRPGVAVVFMSGYSDERALGDLVRRGEAVMVRKPFTPNTLAKELRRVLDERREGPAEGGSGAQGVDATVS
ncbi:MAG: ATP-binding protein [Acidobacteriota bacterium]